MPIYILTVLVVLAGCIDNILTKDGFRFGIIWSSWQFGVTLTLWLPD